MSITITGNDFNDCAKALNEHYFEPEEMFIEKYDEVPIDFSVNEKYSVISVTWKCRHEEPSNELYCSEEEMKALLERLKECCSWLDRDDYE